MPMPLSSMVVFLSIIIIGYILTILHVSGMNYTHNAESADNGGGGSASGLSTTATIIIIAAVAVGVVIVIIIIVLVVVLRRRNNRNKGQAAHRGVKQNTYAERVVFKNERRSPMPEPRRNGNATVRGLVLMKDLIEELIPPMCKRYGKLAIIS